MNDQERLRAEFDAEFLKDLATAETETKAEQKRDKQHQTEHLQSETEVGTRPSENEDELAVLAPFTRSVIETIRTIPEGKIMSYGQVAAVAGSPRGARQVVRILHSMSRKYGLPWHRVVNIRGEIALDEHGGGGEQQERLEAEGVEFSIGGRIDLNRYRYEADHDAD